MHMFRFACSHTVMISTTWVMCPLSPRRSGKSGFLVSHYSETTLEPQLLTFPEHLSSLLSDVWHQNWTQQKPIMFTMKIPDFLKFVFQKPFFCLVFTDLYKLLRQVVFICRQHLVHQSPSSINITGFFCDMHFFKLAILNSEPFFLPTHKI